MLLILHVAGRESLSSFQAAQKKRYVKQKATFNDASLALEKDCFEALLLHLYIGSISINTISVSSKSRVLFLP